MKFLLIDFGATHTKAVFYNSGDKKFLFPKVFPTLSNSASSSYCFEINAAEIQRQFLSICEDFANNTSLPRFEGILICSQMHGFLLVDSQHKPLTPYISWRDERSLIELDGQSTFSLISEAWPKEKYKKITGMIPRPGLPYMNIFHLAREGKLPASFKILSLPEWIALSHQEALNIGHSTMLAGSGCFDICKNVPSTELLNFLKSQTGCSLVFNHHTSQTDIAGFIQLQQYPEKTPIFSGIGDHQCALLGAKNTENTISINLGTGSQVSLISNEPLFLEDLELRPFYGNQYLITQTHIPAGRALATYMNFLESIAKELCNLSSYKAAWSYLEEVSVQDILTSTLTIDLALFKSASNYQEGGHIKNISEGSLTLKNYTGSLLRNFLNQYVGVVHRIIKALHKSRVPSTHCLFSGGVARKLPQLLEAFSLMTGFETSLTPLELDETLHGLAFQADLIANQQH